MTLIQTLNRFPLLHFIINRCGLRIVANAWLRQFPRIITTGDCTVRCRYLESVALADELFSQHLYDSGIPATTATFADLGSNTGFFPVLLKSVTHNPGLQGLTIDANPDMVKETNWHIRRNNLNGVHALYGFVGDSRSGEHEFYLSTSNLMSSAYPLEEPGIGKKWRWEKVKVPTVDLEAAWLKNLGDIPCDLLKIDIEGAEKEFFEPGNPFVKRVGRVLLEWHGWIVSEEEMKKRLALYGFRHLYDLERLPTRGVGVYVRETMPSQ